MASEIMENVKPTRMELLKLRKKYKLAEKGHKLLGEKRDALVVEFMKVIKKRGSLRFKAKESLQRGYRSLARSKMTLGGIRVEELLKSMEWKMELDVGSLNIMGITVPKLKLNTTEDIETRLSLLDSNSYLDEAKRDMEEAFKKLVLLAEVEGTIERLAREIEKTKRRVNALEYIFLPRIKSTQKYIEMMLQEKEREDFFRRKKIKNVMEREKKNK